MEKYKCSALSCSSLTGYGRAVLATFNNEKEAEEFKTFCYISKVFTDLYIYDEYRLCCENNNLDEVKVIAETSVFNHSEFTDKIVGTLLADFRHYTMIKDKIASDGCLTINTYKELQDMIKKGKLVKLSIDASEIKELK